MKSFPLPIKAVVIDLDGTLLNTAPDLAYAAELMMAELGLPCPSLETISTYIGNGVSRLVKRVLTGDMDAEPDAALFEQAIASYNKHYSAHVSLHSRPFPGVVEGLQVADTSVYYPEDRGISESVRIAAQLAARIG
jgi:phosphoglycolate phosphatase